MKDINFNRIYVYEINKKEHYVFVYTKSILFNLFHLDDKFKTKDNEINSVASNENSKDIKIKTIINKNTIDYISYYIIAIFIIFYINYRKFIRW